MHRSYLAAGAIYVDGGDITTHGKTTFVSNAAGSYEGDTQAVLDKSSRERGTVVVLEGGVIVVTNRHRESC